MKILTVKFKNINSLSGENEIDFTKPVFLNEGLFVITGKTGSGKSSILDAISLALYGKTPRVKITNSDNAVMTRGEKDCYSEIVFEVAGNKWKSSWKQELTREGTLKPVIRIIADSNDKIIAEKVSSCDKKIIEIIGLTFEQFTKVIMLAQGSFAAFLQADKNDKSQLLEQITGTEIYGEISKKVFERIRTEKEKLERITVEIDSIKILSEEEINELTDEVAILEKDKKQVDSELQNIEKAKNWLIDLGDLQNRIYETKQKQPELENRAKITIEVFEKAKRDLISYKGQLKKQEPIFKEVRELDTKISEKQNIIQPILYAISELEKSINDLSQTIENQNADLDKSQNSLTLKQDWATKNKKYEELVTKYAAIEKENQLLINSSNEIDELSDEIAENEQVLESINTEVKTAIDSFNEKSQCFTAKTNELKKIKTQLKQILKENDLAELQTKKENIVNAVTQINNLIDVENAILTSKKEINGLVDNIKTIDNKVKEISAKIEKNEDIRNIIEEKINILDDSIKLTKTIQSLDAHRRNLKDGEACPLCGALEHPFALKNVPQIGEKENELKTLKIQLKETTDTIQNEREEFTKLNSDKTNIYNSQKKEEKALSQQLEKQKDILSEMKILIPNFSIPKDEIYIVRLNDILREKQEERKAAESLISEATKIEKQLNNLRDNEIPQLQEEKEAAEKSKNEIETEKKLSEQKLKTQKEHEKKLQNKYKEENESFLRKLNNYEAKSIEDLKNCLNTWNDNKIQMEELNTRIATLSGQISLNKNELENKGNVFNEKQTEKQIIETGIYKLSERREEIFGDKSVEDEENLLKNKLDDAEAAKEKSEKEMNKANTELENSQAIILEKEKELSKKQAEKITEKSLEELELELDINKYKSEELSQKTGAKKQLLKTNAESLKTSGTKMKEKEKQKQTCDKWGRLNDLIGSADGKKYRNFAQALTFEHLIDLANQQLQKMSERYILKRTDDSSNPFDLSVIDKFQNSEERTAQNLSGGEKFIVSLTLALGLANMAGKNMRIDTMFIDEGFGTLDSDYLDVALSALSNLQSEGKIIGVISHLTELKDRISTHIEIIQGSNGCSQIQISN